MFPLTRVVLLTMFCSLSFLLPSVFAQDEPLPLKNGGEILVLDAKDQSVHLGSCPLKHTDVRATIMGSIVRTTVKQTFENTFDRPIEAQYIFPLPDKSAVDEMKMIIGNRYIVGEIHERQEALEIYEEAKAEGKTASLLNQERPNCFTQRIANIAPGEAIQIEISFLESTTMDEGVYQWTFPMTVGPRYCHDQESAEASAPPTTLPERRAGHTISLTVEILGSAKVYDIQSTLHEVETIYTDYSSARVTLANQEEIPNRDFILKFRSGGNKVGEGLFVYENKQGSYFSLLVQPPERTAPSEILPREVIFVIDASGSMHGEPLDTAKRTMAKCIETLGPDDTFNLLATQACFNAPVSLTESNLNAALQFLNSLEAGGGTEMMPAVTAALGGNHDPSRLRLVCFMTDGYIGYEYELLSEIQKNVENSRVFSFGIGNGVNRYLLDQMAQLGRGDVSYVTLGSDAQAQADRFLMRIHAPILTDISLDWGKLPVADVTPEHVADLFSESPIMVFGRLEADIDELKGKTLSITGKTASGEYHREIPITAAKSDQDLSFIPKLWARSRINDLMLKDLEAAQYRRTPDEIRQQIIDVSVKHRVLSDYTAFVAVEKQIKVDPETSLEVLVPVETLQGATATATNDWAYILSGFLLCLAGAFLFLIRGKFLVKV